jgi:hypothetical protein
MHSTVIIEFDEICHEGIVGPRQQSSFFGKPTPRIGAPRHALVQDLQGHDCTIGDIARPVNRPHPSFAQSVEQFKSTDAPRQLRSRSSRALDDE